MQENSLCIETSGVWFVIGTIWGFTKIGTVEWGVTGEGWSVQVKDGRRECFMHRVYLCRVGRWSSVVCVTQWECWGDRTMPHGAKMGVFGRALVCLVRRLVSKRACPLRRCMKTHTCGACDWRQSLRATAGDGSLKSCHDRWTSGESQHAHADTRVLDSVDSGVWFEYIRVVYRHASTWTANTWLPWTRW